MTSSTDTLTRALFPSAKGKVYLPADIVRRVTNGVEFLDATIPNWANIVDLDVLDLKHGCNCVMGQLVSSVNSGCTYYDAVGYPFSGDGDGDALPSFLRDGLDEVAMSHNEAVDRGFHVSYSGDDNDYGKVEWEQLTLAWRREIKRRRIAAKRRAALTAEWAAAFPNN